MNNLQYISIPQINICWSDWVQWDNIQQPSKLSSINIPDKAGVYEVARNCDVRHLYDTNKIKINGYPLYSTDPQDVVVVL
jgi:hypothetical protein